jgi:hypothetical protein
MSPRIDKCTSCGALMLWALSERGKPIPLNVIPAEAGPSGGNMALRWARGELTARVLTTGQDTYDGPLYQAHFMTCDFAGHHRGNPRRNP